jgi:hypothetical protein
MLGSHLLPSHLTCADGSLWEKKPTNPTTYTYIQTYICIMILMTIVNCGKKTHEPYYIYLYTHLYMHRDSHDHSKVRAFATSFHVHMLFFYLLRGAGHSTGTFTPPPSHHHHVTCVLAMRTIHTIILLGTKPHGTFTNTSTRVDRSF